MHFILLKKKYRRILEVRIKSKVRSNVEYYALLSHVFQVNDC